MTELRRTFRFITCIRFTHDINNIYVPFKITDTTYYSRLTNMFIRPFLLNELRNSHPHPHRDPTLSNLFHPHCPQCRRILKDSLPNISNSKHINGELEKVLLRIDNIFLLYIHFFIYRKCIYNRNKDNVIRNTNNDLCNSGN